MYNVVNIGTGLGASDVGGRRGPGKPYKMQERKGNRRANIWWYLYKFMFPCEYIYKKLNKILLKGDLGNEKTEMTLILMCIKHCNVLQMFG